MKKSFAMLLAIAFILVLGSIGILMVLLSGLTLKQTTDNYISLQSELYAKSATEFAIQALESRDFDSDGCINKIDINSSIYDINMTFHYFLTKCPSDCNCSEIVTPESNGTVMINTYVRTKVEDNETMPRVFFRQTLQKP